MNVIIDNKTKTKSSKKIKSVSRKKILNKENTKLTKKQEILTSKKTKRKEKYNPRIKKLIEDGRLKKPEELRVGYISRNLYGNRYIVKYDNIRKKKYYTKANKKEIACNNLLKENMNKFIGIYKKTNGKGFLKSYIDAKKMAINETRKKFPTCLVVNDKYSKYRETETTLNMITRNIKYYTRYVYYKIIRLLFK